MQKKPQSTQRDLANDLGISLGKLNYCLKALKEKGLITEEIFSDAEELLIKSEIDISSK